MILKNEFSLYLIFSLLIAIFWSIGIFSTWSTDYSGYYAGSMFNSDDYKLYENHFAHKGPAYYFFINIKIFPLLTNNFTNFSKTSIFFLLEKKVLIDLTCVSPIPSRDLRFINIVFLFDKVKSSRNFFDFIK